MTQDQIREAWEAEVAQHAHKIKDFTGEKSANWGRDNGRQFVEPKKIIQIMRENGPVTRKFIADIIGCAGPTISVHLKALIDQGLVHKQGDYSAKYSLRGSGNE